MQQDDDLFAEFEEAFLEAIEEKTLDDYLLEALQLLEEQDWLDGMDLGDIEDEEDDY